MKNFSLIALLFLIVALPVTGQQRRNGFGALKSILHSADSVLLISHLSTNGITLVDSVNKKELPLPQLFLKGKLNQGIVLERNTLGPREIDQLAQILSRPFEDAMVSSAKCFIPHHAILIYKKKKISFLDLCFACRKFTTKNLPDIGVFDQRKWQELHAFFRQNKMTYKLDAEGEQ